MPNSINRNKTCPSNHKRVGRIILLSALLILFSTKAFASENEMKELIGQDVPLFMLNDTENKRYNLRDQLNKVILINFFFVGCAPCEKELPELDKIKEFFTAKDFELIVINGLNQPHEQIRSFLKTIGAPHLKALIDNLGNTVKRFKVEQYPTTFLINKEGKIDSVYGGFPQGFEIGLKKNIQTLLSK